MRARGWTGVAATAVTCAVLGASAGTASANENVLLAIQQQNHIVRSSGIINRIEHLLHERESRGLELRLARAYDAYGVTLRHSASVVSRSSADSTRQADGRRAWVLYARDGADAISGLGRAFDDLAHGRVAVARRLLKAVRRDQARSKASLRTAERLLA